MSVVALRSARQEVLIVMGRYHGKCVWVRKRRQTSFVVLVSGWLGGLAAPACAANISAEAAIAALAAPTAPRPVSQI